jgi:glycosyltransferase involved in cell wall biosynthesis
LTVDVGDVDQLATSVRRLYEDPNLLKELGGNAREAVEQFDREVVLGKLLEWMQPITSGGHIVPNSALNDVETR